MIVPLERRFGEELAQGAGGGAGSIGELGHQAIRRALPGKTGLRPRGDPERSVRKVWQKG